MPAFLLCYEATREDGYCWAIRYQDAWQLARHVQIDVACSTALFPPCNDPEQPTAALVGIGELVDLGEGRFRIVP